MIDKLRKRIVSGVMAAVLAISNTLPMPLQAIAEDAPDSELCYQSIVVSPEGSEDSRIVLNGMMPEGATAEAVDVSDEYSGIAAYDITINDGSEEFQPEEGSPILVEIRDPVITGSSGIELWHIQDSGVREQIKNIVVKEGKIYFLAEGFSVYEIAEDAFSFKITYPVETVSGDTSFSVMSVDADTVDPISDFTFTIEPKTSPKLIEKITTIEQLESYDLTKTGFYLCGGPGESNNGVSKFATDATGNTSRSGIVLTDTLVDKGNKNASNAVVNKHQLLYNAVETNKAVPFYFESTGTDHQYYIYCTSDKGVTKHYIKNDPNNSLKFATGKSDATPYVIEPSTTSSDSIKIRTANELGGKYWYWNYRNGEGGPARFSGTDGSQYANTANNNIYIWYYALDHDLEEDPYDLNGKTYGLVSMVSSDVYAITTVSNTSNELKGLQITSGEGSYSSPYAVTGWTFEWVEGTDKYKLSAYAENGAAKKYLQLGSDGIHLVDEADASALTVTPNYDNGKIKLSLPQENLSIYYNNKLFRKAASDTNDQNRYLDLVNVPEASTDALDLDNKTYALINRNGSSGYALLAAAQSATALKSQTVTARTNDAGKTEYVFFGDLSQWTFHHIDHNRYTISNGTKYLKLVDGSLTVTDEPYILTVVAGSGDNEGKIKICNSTDSKAIKKGSSNFQNNPIANGCWFDLTVVPDSPDSDPLNLDENTYGIVGLNSSKYYAMQAQQNASGLDRQLLTLNASGQLETSDRIVSGWTFHWVDKTNYKISDTSGKYIKVEGSALSLVDDPDDASTLSAEVGTGDNAGKIKLYDTAASKYINCGNTFVSNASGGFFTLVSVENQIDPYKLSGKTYGFMAHTDGSSFGYAMSAGESVVSSKLYELETLDSHHNERVLYVPSGSDLTQWTFECVSEDNYRLKAPSGKYLKQDGTALTLAESSDSATAFKVVPNADKTISLKSGSYYVCYNSAANSFELSADSASLYFVKEAEVTSEDSLTYTAKRISVSDGDIAKNDAKLIVYTRIWDEKAKQYDFYAIDHNGTLRQVYAYGDKIMWLDDNMNTLLWEFTVYTGSNGKENGYYELKNTYSDKYIAPQMTGDQILSDSKIGILMQGRTYEVDNTTGKITYGEYYSNIMAWDQGYRQYVSVACDKANGTIKAAPLSQADTFYFAVLDDVFQASETEASLHSVETVDNTQYGITMRVIDFTPDDGDKGSGGGSVTKDYFGYTGNDKGLLSDSLDENGHPTIKKSTVPGKIGADFNTVFNDAVLTNNIFIKSVHESSGYFEYDSCQNFATLVPDGKTELTQQKDKDGHPLYVDKDGKLTTSAKTGGVDNTPIYDFTVYRELGTMESDKPTRKHGQFLPYNYIKPNSYSDVNPQNLYDVLSVHNDPTIGILDDSDPRKYEKLYTVYRKNNGTEKKEADYYLGMEMEATFVQTPSGLDAWGHDVIFEFTGDDDFWLYVDGELILDLGGIHSAEYGKVNFRTGNVEVNGTKTTLKDIFYQHYLKKKYTLDEAKTRILVRDLHEDRSVTLDEFKAHYQTEYDQRLEEYKNAHSEISDEENRTAFDALLSIELERRKITFDEYREWYPEVYDYDTKLNYYQTKPHDATDAETYINGLFEYNDEKEEANKGYVFKDYTTHDMKIYYMERGAGASNLHMKFNLSSVTPGNVLFAKTLSGVDEDDDMDFDLVTYPFQIFYKVQESDSEWTPLTDFDRNNNVSVSYQNSTQTVRYAATYYPPGSETETFEGYKNVFFLIPGKNIEINFPDEAMFYYVKECAVNPEIYDVTSPTANNGTVDLGVEDAPNGVVGNLKDLITSAAQVSELPTIAFDNKVKEGSIRTLNITKKLYDEHYDKSKTKAENAKHLLHYDPNSTSANVDNSTFAFRLSYYDEVEKKWEPADMERYYIADPKGYLVKWYPEEGVYKRYNAGTEEEPFYIKNISQITNETARETAKTLLSVFSSRFGSIADIPTGYTVKIPGLVVGTEFKVEEKDSEIPVGYDLIDFQCETDTIDGTGENASYHVLSSDNSTGQIIAGSDAYMTVSNRRGIGLEADKIWSDSDFASSHGNIYVAVFDGSSTVPVEGTVRRIESPETKVKYFFKNLPSGKNISDYQICEVTVGEPMTVVKDNEDDKVGKVTAYSSISRIPDGGQILQLDVTDNSNNTVQDNYTVSYDKGTPQATGANGVENVRIDTIHNKRNGGIEINLYEWNKQTDAESDIPLSGGAFVLSRLVGDEYEQVGSEPYVSDSRGCVTVLYGIKVGEKYKLEEIVSPRGYIGAAEPIYFEVGKNDQDKYIIKNWSNANDADNDSIRTDGKNWAEYTTPTEVMAAKIDVYNKPYTLQMIKVDGNTKKGLDGVEFKLYKDTVILGEMRKGFKPVAGYESLVTDENGVIPKIDNTLPPLENKKYYLEEFAVKEGSGYTKLDEDIIFTVSELGIIECKNENASELLKKDEEEVGNTLRVTYTISIPNTLPAQDRYFSIEKISMADKFIHGKDPDSEQKFVFRVERFDSADTSMSTPLETFFVTMNCETPLDAYPYADALGGFDKHTYSFADKTVTVTCGDSKDYTFPAALYSGSRTVKVNNSGIYRVTEVTDLSSTDYDFWTGSNVFVSADSSRHALSEGAAAKISSTDRYNNCPCVVFELKDSDTEKNGCPKVSFTNTETEYAYLSTQAYAENKIALS